MLLSSERGKILCFSKPAMQTIYSERRMEAMLNKTFLPGVKVKNPENAARARKGDIITKIGPLMPSEIVKIYH